MIALIMLSISKGEDNMKRFIVVLLLVAFLIPTMVFAAGKGESASPKVIISDDDFDLDELIKLAQAEGKLTITDTTSRIVAIGEEFGKKYGIEVKATKMGNQEQIQRVRREVDSGNVQTDIIGIADAPTLENDLLPSGYVINWIPPNMKDLIPQKYQTPLAYRLMARVVGYNTDAYPSSPVTNIWELTEPKWFNKLMLSDPAITPDTIGYFATLTRDDYAKTLAEEYQKFYGKPLVTNEKNAGWEFLKRLFANRPTTFVSDQEVVEAVGAPGQVDPPLGFYNYTKHRDNVTRGLKLGVSFELKPLLGYTERTFIQIVKNAPNPNAARLFVHYMLTEEGVKHFTGELGGYSPNPNIGVHPDDDLGSFDKWSEHIINIDGNLAWKLQEDILDLWMISRY